MPRLRRRAVSVVLALAGGLLPVAAAAPARAADDLLDGFSRTAVRDLWNGTAVPALAVPTAWTGSVSECRAGAPSAAAARAGLDIVNVFRDLADVRRVTLDDAASRQAQAAALMMEARGGLSHFPDPSWACFTEEGKTGAARSNLSLGRPTAAASIASGYMDDPGSNNHAVGHRRWVLDPGQVTMGLGQTARANALHVFGERTPDPSAPRWTPWPSAGYLPVQAEPEGRWSLAAPGDDADFARAQVRVTEEGGREVPVTVYPVEDRFGYSNAVVFEAPTGYRAGVPDRSYTVTVSGVVRAGRSTGYTWTTRLFDATRDQDQVPVPRPGELPAGSPAASPSPASPSPASPSPSSPSPSSPSPRPTATSPSPGAPTLLPGRMHPLTPARVLDTRDGTGGVTGRLADDVPVTVRVAGRGGVPAQGAEAVLLNVTSTGGRAAGHLTVYPAGRAVPTASSVNAARGATVANLVAVPLGADGSVSVVSSDGQPAVLADVVGWYGAGTTADPGSGLVGLAPSRVLDTRDGTGGAPGRLQPRVAVDLPVLGRGGVPLEGVDAVVLSVTATQPARSGHLTVSPGGREAPEASTLNFPAGSTVANLAVVPLGRDGTVRLTASDGTPHVLADVVGYLSRTGGASFRPLAPARVLDTRTGDGGLRGPLPARGVQTFRVAGAGGVPSTGATAVLMNVTAVQPRGTGHLTVFPGGASAPEASNLNHVAGQTVPALVVVPLGPGGTVSVRSSAGSPFLLADVVGWYQEP